MTPARARPQGHGRPARGPARRRRTDYRRDRPRRGGRQAGLADGAVRRPSRARPRPRPDRRRAAALRRGPRQRRAVRGDRLRRPQPLGAARGVGLAGRPGPVRHHGRRRRPRRRAARHARARVRNRDRGRPALPGLPLNGVLVAALGAYGSSGHRARARGRRTPARHRRPLGLQPQLPDDVVGRPARARRAAQPGPPRRVAGGVRRPAGGRSRRGGPEPAGPRVTSSG